MRKQVKLVVITTTPGNIRLTRYLENRRESAVEMSIHDDTTAEGLRFVIEDYRVNGDRAVK